MLSKKCFGGLSILKICLKAARVCQYSRCQNLTPPNWVPNCSHNLTTKFPSRLSDHQLSRKESRELWSKEELINLINSPAYHYYEPLMSGDWSCIIRSVRGLCIFLLSYGDLWCYNSCNPFRAFLRKPCWKENGSKMLDLMCSHTHLKILIKTNHTGRSKR